jgi:hypothetical protein
MHDIYGDPPKDLGLIDLSPVEMMAWLYLPITLPGLWSKQVPQNLLQFMPIIQAVCDDIGEAAYVESYIYITAKTLWVTPDSPGNRPGWHSDGFMTDDLNYVWSDRNPTLFWVSPDPIRLTQDHEVSMQEMEAEVSRTGDLRTYPDKHLLKLDQSCIHRVADVPEAGMRTFVKVSVSKHLYSQVGNSINHNLDYPRPSIARGQERNCPAATS